MQPIVGTIFPLKQALKQKLPIAATPQGEWKIDSQWHYWLNRKRAHAALIGAFGKALDALEYYNSLDLRPYIEGGDLLHEYAQGSPNLWEVDMRVYALRMRLGQEKPVEGPFNGKFFLKACDWKSRQKYSPNGALNPKQMKYIEKTMQYPKYIQLLEQNSKLRKLYYKWTIRDENDPETLMRYPGLALKIYTSTLSARTGYDDLLKLTENSLVIRCEGGKELDLRDPTATVSLAFGFQVDFKDICHCFANRVHSFGGLETGPQGVFNWSPRHYGPYDPQEKGYKQIDFNAERWWEQLPMEDISTPQELKYKFKLTELPDGVSWFFSAVGASASNKEVLVGGTHGYHLVSIPIADGRYAHYSFGKYMFDVFPSNNKELIRVLMQTVPARVISPDGTARNSSRDKEYLTAKMTPEEGLHKMSAIKVDILKGMKGEMPFQLFSFNCFKWSLELIKDKVPAAEYEACYVNPMEADVSGWLRIALKIYRLIPKFLIRPILNFFAWLFGGYKELPIKQEDGTIKMYRFIDHAPWHPENNSCANPSLLVLRRREGLVY